MRTILWVSGVISMLPPINYEELKNKLNGIPIWEHDVFLKLTYATLGRVGEIVRGRCKENPPVATKDIEERVTPGGRRQIVITVLTEKAYTYRKILVNRDREPWLTEPILEYAKNKQGPLFPFSTRWAQKVFEKYFSSQNIHAMRHWRATHLKQGKVTGKPLDDGAIRRMGGWTDTTTLNRIYDGSVIEDYEELI